MTELKKNSVLKNILKPLCAFIFLLIVGQIVVLQMVRMNIISVWVAMIVNSIVIVTIFGAIYRIIKSITDYKAKKKIHIE